MRICVIGEGGVYEKLVLAPSDKDQELSSRRKIYKRRVKFILRRHMTCRTNVIRCKLFYDR